MTEREPFIHPDEMSAGEDSALVQRLKAEVAFLLALASSNMPPDYRPAYEAIRRVRYSIDLEEAVASGRIPVGDQ